MKQGVRPTALAERLTLAQLGFTPCPRMKRQLHVLNSHLPLEVLLLSSFITAHSKDAYDSGAEKVAYTVLKFELGAQSR